MPITLVATTTSTGTEYGPAQFQLSGLGAQVGDIVVAILARYWGPYPNTPYGASWVRRVNNSHPNQSGCTIILDTLLVDAAALSQNSFSWSGSVDDNNQLAVYCFRGASGIATPGTTESGGSAPSQLASTNFNFPERNCVAVYGWATWGNATITLPGDLTNHVVPSTFRVSARTKAGLFSRAAPGSVGTKTATFDQNINCSFAGIVVVPQNTAPTTPGAFTAPTSGEMIDAAKTISWGASTDPDGDAVSYQLQLSVNGGSTYATIKDTSVGGTSTSFAYDFSSQPATSNARLRVRAYDGKDYSAWRTSSTFTIAHPPPTPTGVTPSSGATVNTDLPSLGVTLGSWDGVSRQKGRWQLATNAGFTTNVREISESDADLRFGGGTTEALPGAAELTQGTWYIRARAVAETGMLSAWTAGHAFTVSHPPTTTNHAPTGGPSFLYDDGDVDLEWTFSDTSPTDEQIAYQVIVERNSDGVVVADTGKVTSGAGAATVSIPLAYKGALLRWKVRVWDSDDVAGSYSSYHTFTLADAPTVTITAPADGNPIDTPTPTVTWTFEGYGGRAQRERRVRFIHATTGEVAHDSGWHVTTDTTYKPSSTDMETAEQYRIVVDVRDTSFLTNSDEITVASSWVPPESTSWNLNMSTVEDGGYVEITWSDAQKDQEWYSWQVWRRPVGGSWEMLAEFRTTVEMYEFRDYLFASGVDYQWSVVEVVERFSNLVSGPYNPQNGTPTPSDYWFVYSNDEADWERNFRLYQVTGDDFADEYEQEQTHIIGRGRHVDYGDRLGYAGTLTVQLRSQERLGVSAREQRLRLEAFRDERGTAYMRNPFGDLFRVAAGDLRMARLAGTGVLEFGDVTLPYYEVADE